MTRQIKSSWLVPISLSWIGIIVLFLGCDPVGTETKIVARSNKIIGHDRVYELLSTGNANELCYEIQQKWHPGIVAMLLEVIRFNENPQTGGEVLRLLEAQTGQKFRLNLDQWYEWIWNQPYNPHPEYGEFKGKVFADVDPSFAEYFVKADNAEIRLDEIRWGGVTRDGIPPLSSPKMIKADQADYLDDSNVVFGVVIDGDVRCYPKRILAWHEMFKDTIGGQRICGVY